MQELYLAGPGDLQLREALALRELQAGEVRVKVIYGGICGSDLRVYKGTLSYAQYPLRPGHEVLGTVEEAGSESGLSVGDRIVVFPNTYCGECAYCRSGQTNICQAKTSFGVSVPGVFAEEIVVEGKYAVPVPLWLKNERAILIEPFAVTVHALKKCGNISGLSVAVMGCGTEGLLTVALALKLGAQVSAIDINPQKLAIAKEIGEIEVLTPAEATGKTFDVVLEAAGVKSAIEQAIQMVKPGGCMVALGITGEPASLIPMHIVRNEIILKGTIIYTKEDFTEAIDLLSEQDLNVEPVVSRYVPLDQYQSAYDDALSGNFAKLVLVFS